MNVLVVGSGGREHALVESVARSPRVKRIFCAPGNGGTAAVATNLLIRTDDFPALIDAARTNRIDLTIVGPEAPLCAGIVDRFREAGLRIFGPTAAAARIEGDKGYAKRLMKIAHVPMAEGRVFQSYDAAREYVSTRDTGLVVKAAGLAGGKGVFVCPDPADGLLALDRLMVQRMFGIAGETVVVEEQLKGTEVSVFALVAGNTIYVLDSAQDYKRLGDNDSGPNTGGMGAISPSSLATADTLMRIQRDILVPIVDALRTDDAAYQGVLYAGLMLTAAGPKVLEFNCRLGDPEAEVLLPRLESDLVDAIEATLDDRLEEIEIRWSPQVCVGVVMASSGYPDHYDTGRVIHGLESLRGMQGVSVYHSATSRIGQRLLTGGGRVLVVTGLGNSVSHARERAYSAVERISFDNAYFRRDISVGL